MSQFKRTTNKIHGNGNAIGDGNSITNIKETHNHEHRQRSGDSDSPAAPCGLILIVAFGITLAMTALAYWFGKHATVVYAAELSLPFACAVTAALLMIYNAYHDDLSSAAHSGVVAIIAATLTFAVKLASASYSADWMDLADGAQSSKQFWCSLPFADQQSALQHTIQALVLLAPAAILVVVHTLAIPFSDDDLPEWLSNVFSKMTGTTSLVITGVLCVLSLIAHTESSFSMWQDKFNSDASLVCPNKKS
ncbi:MAG: hypothetical protein V4476_12995 [Pseudomonadota bacterium]